MSRLQPAYRPAEKVTDHLKQIIELQSVLASANFDLSAFMNLVVERVQSLTPATGAVIELLDGDDMVYRAASGSAAAYIDFRIKAFGSLSGLCVHSGRILYSEDTSCDPRVNSEACKKVHAASMVVVPLYRQGQTVGVLKILSNKIYSFDQHDIQTLELIAGLLGGALGQQLEIDARRHAEAKLKFTAEHDALTRLPNRYLFRDRLAHALARYARSGKALALMYMDIDHFKSINDTYGHATGDALLKTFAERVQSCIRASDTFARLGGDEFVLIAEDIQHHKDVEIIASKIIDAMRDEFSIEGQRLKIATSIGIAFASREDREADKLIDKADAALYEAKKSGRNRFCLAAG